MSDVAIVGGGLAGGAAAAWLARAGRRVTLIEREAGPHDKICGEFLSIEAQGALVDLGIDLPALGAAPIDTLRLVWGGRTIEVRLPFVARGLGRRLLDEALLDRAAVAGARIERGVAARSIGPDAIETTQGRVAAETILLASGKHEVRGAPRDVAGSDTGYVGFKLHWRLPPAARARLAGRIDVVLFDGGYAGLQLVEGGIANLCLLVRKPRLAEEGGWPGLLDALLAEPHLAAILGDGEPLWPRPLAIAGVPYGFLHHYDGARGPFRLGDQAAVIPSFCGDGMAIALHSARRAADTLASGGDARAYHRRLRRDLGAQIGLAMRMQRTAERGWSRPLLLAALAGVPALAPLLARATRVRAAA